MGGSPQCLREAMGLNFPTVQELEAWLGIFGGVATGARKPGSGLDFNSIKALVEPGEGVGEGETM